MKKLITVFLLSSLILFTVKIMPAISADNEIEELKKQVDQLQTKVEQLEQENQQMRSNPQSQQKRNDPFDSFFNGGDPFQAMERMQDQMNRMFSQGQNQNMAPGMDMLNNDFKLNETKDGYEIRFDTTGLNKNKLDVEINPNSVTVKGEYSQEDQQTGKDRYYSSKQFGSFLKTIPLPVDANTEKTQTKKEGNELVIDIPKK